MEVGRPGRRESENDARDAARDAGRRRGGPPRADGRGAYRGRPLRPLCVQVLCSQPPRWRTKEQTQPRRHPSQKRIPSPSSRTSASSLDSALDGDFHSRRPPSNKPARTHTSPPPFYQPYPYPKQWTLERKLDQRERSFWHHREDEWTHNIHGKFVLDVRHRTWCVFTDGIRKRQRTAAHEAEEAKMMQRATDGEGTADEADDLALETNDGSDGLPVRTLMSGRRAIEAVLKSSKAKVFESSAHDTIRVQIKVSRVLCFWPPARAPRKPSFVRHTTIIRGVLQRH